MKLSKKSIFRSLILASTVVCSIGWNSFTFGQSVSAEKEKEMIALLKSNGPEADKALACKQLALNGSAAAVPDLAALLKDEHLASWARIALEAIPDKSVDEALLKATYSLQGRLLVGVINSIGVRRDPSAVDSLKARLLDKDMEVASAAAVSLGKIGNSGATQFLSDMLGEANPALKISVARGLVLCAERSMNQGNNVEAIKIYDKVRMANVSKQRTVEATRGAILARKTDGIPLLLEQLRSPEKTLFQSALGTARELAGKEVDKALAAELTKAAPDRAAMIIYAMADRKGTVEMPAILASAKAGPAVVRLAAINALATVGDSSCVSTLLSIAGEPETTLSQAAKTALSNISDEGVSKSIMESLSKAEGKMVALLIEVIGLRQIQATQELVKSLKSSDKEIRTAALKALGNTVPISEMSVLIEQVIAPKPDDQEAAVLALKTAAVRMPNRDECAIKLTEASKSASMATRKTLIGILGAVGGAKALESVAAAAKSDEIELKDASTRALGEWTTPDAGPVLLELLKSGAVEKFRNRAFGGYLRIARQFVQDADRVAMCKKAMELTQSQEEKDRVVDVLTRYPTIQTLKLAIEWAGTAELKDVATKAAIAIASSDKLGNRAAEAKTLLSKAGIGQ